MSDLLSKVDAHLANLTVLPKPKAREKYKLYVVLAILQVLDVVTTGWVLHHFSTAAEANPLVSHLFSTTGLFAGLAVLLAFKLGMVYLLWTCQTGVKIASAVYGAVIVNNILAALLILTQ